MTAYEKCSRCKYKTRLMYQHPCYLCKNESDFEEQISDEEHWWKCRSWWYEHIIAKAKDIQKFSACLHNLDIYNRAVEIEAIANSDYRGKDRDNKKPWENEATKVKERAEKKYQEALYAYVRLFEINKDALSYHWDRDYERAVCLGEVLGYGENKVKADIEEMRKKLNG